MASIQVAQVRLDHFLLFTSHGASLVFSAHLPAHLGQLALRHRNQHQRIVLFIGSPAQADTAALTKLGQALKKNNVAVDIVCFGEVEENREKLEAFIKAVNSNENSHLVVVEPGSRTLSEALRTSPLSGRAPSEGGAAGEGEDFFGIDANEDPELAMVYFVNLCLFLGYYE